MKKIILLTSLLLLSLSVFAQSKARFGLRAGANISKLTNLDNKNKTDFYFGAILALKINESYTLQPEFTYSQQGGTLTENNFVLNEQNERLKDINIDFLSLAVINKIQANNNIHFLIGPFIDFRIDDNVNNDSYVLEGLFPRMDIGIMAGFGFDIMDNLSIEARFKHGFVDMINEHDIFINARTDDTNYNQVFQLGIVYKFNTKTNK